MQKIISIIIPVYNEEKNIPLINSKLEDIFLSLDYDYEIIFINDGSSDHSQFVIWNLAKKNKKIKSIEFLKNFGKEAALTAGLQYATGEAAIIIDADLQHPVSLIPLFIENWENGADVVIGLRTKNKGQSLLKIFFSFLFYKLVKIIGNKSIKSGVTDFRLIDRKVISKFNNLPKRNYMVRARIDQLGFKSEYIKFEAGERASGVASYSYFKLIKLAIFSLMPKSMSTGIFCKSLDKTLYVIKSTNNLRDF